MKLFFNNVIQFISNVYGEQIPSKKLPFYTVQMKWKQAVQWTYFVLFEGANVITHVEGREREEERVERVERGREREEGREGKKEEKRESKQKVYYL